MSNIAEQLAWIAASQPPPEARVPARQESSARWAKVTQTNPLRIRYDRESAELSATPSSTVGRLWVNRRVWVQRAGRRLVVTGAFSVATDWVDCTLLSGFTARSPEYRPQVRRDNDAMVHFRGHLAAAPTGLSGNVPVLQMPTGFWPDVEARWLGFMTARANRPYGGWIGTADGILYIQTDTGNTDPLPTVTHWAIIVQPWQAQISQL